jgi:taurine transport system substrate-binding protein
LALAAWFAAPAHAQTKEVTIGYQDMVVPYRVAQEAKDLERQPATRSTGSSSAWRRGDQGHGLGCRADRGGRLGRGRGRGFRGEPYELFWILDDIGDAEALVVKNGSGINTVADLKGKKMRQHSTRRRISTRW